MGVVNAGHALQSLISDDDMKTPFLFHEVETALQDSQDPLYGFVGRWILQPFSELLVCFSHLLERYDTTYSISLQ